MGLLQVLAFCVLGNSEEAGVGGGEGGLGCGQRKPRSRLTELRGRLGDQERDRRGVEISPQG